VINNVPGPLVDWLAAWLLSAGWHSCEPDWTCHSVDQQLAVEVHFAEVTAMPITSNNCNTQSTINKWQYYSKPIRIRYNKLINVYTVINAMAVWQLTIY